MFALYKPQQSSAPSASSQRTNGEQQFSPPPIQHQHHRKLGGGKWDHGRRVKDRDKRRRERLNSELIEAVLQGNLLKVRRLLRENEASHNVYCRDSKATAVHLAAFRGFTDILQALLEAGAQPDAPDAFGRRPVHLAAWAGRIDTIRVIIERSPDQVNAEVGISDSYTWNTRDEDSWDHSHEEVTSILPILFKGETPLHVAAKLLNKEMAFYLLDKGANPKIRDGDGQTPLDVAGIPTERTFVGLSNDHGESERQPSVHDLYNHANYFQKISRRRPSSLSSSFSSKSSDSSTSSSSISSVTKFDTTPTHLKQSKPTFPGNLEPVGLEDLSPESKERDDNFYDIVTALVGKGCDVPKPTEIDGSANRNPNTTTLHTAVIKEDLELIDLLLEKGADPLIFDVNGDSPVHVAVKKRLLKPLMTLLAWLKIGTIDTKNSAGQTALHIAVEEEWASGVGVLLESGSDVRLRNRKQETVIHLSCRLGNPLLLQELLQVDGAHEVVDNEDDDGFAPIFRAIQKNSHECVKLLLESGNANVFQIMTDDINVLHYTAQYGRVPIMGYLLTNTEVTQKLMNKLSLNMNGRAPLHIAAELGKVKSVRELMKAGAEPKIRTTEVPGMRTTAIHLAAKAGHDDVVEAILDLEPSCLFVHDLEHCLPLHSAALHGHGKVVEVMLKRGANVAEPIPWQGTVKTAMDLIASRVPNSADLFEDLLDSYIVLGKDTVNKKNSDSMTKMRDPSTEIHVRFDMFLCSSNNESEHECKQLTFLTALLNTKNNDLKERTILHPLVEIFLFYKWSKMWKFFICLLLLYGAHTLAVTSYSIATFITRPEEAINETSTFPVRLSRNFVRITLIPISIAEFLQAMSIDRFYFSEGETWIKLSLILSSAVLVASPIDAGVWLKNSASVAVLLTWIELLLLLGRFHVFGLHVIMFEKVAINVCKVLLKFLLLFLGFTFAFMIQFGGRWPFEGLIESMTQILVMTVELNYGGVFDSHHADNVAGRILFVAFMVVIAIIVTNLTVGIAVNDVQELEKQGRAELLAKRASFLSFLECVVYNERLTCFFPSRLKDRLGRLRSVDPELIVYPNKPGPIPVSLKTDLLRRVNRSEDDEVLTRSYFNNRITELSTRLDRLMRQIELIRNVLE